MKNNLLQKILIIAGLFLALTLPGYLILAKSVPITYILSVFIVISGGIFFYEMKEKKRSLNK